MAIYSAASLGKDGINPANTFPISGWAKNNSKTNEKPIDCDYIICVSDKKNNSTIQEGDCEDVILLKMFMQEHRICDIKMRPLQITEMLKIMTFPEEYILKGTKTEQKKYIGNAVPPLAAEKIVQKSMMMNF